MKDFQLRDVSDGIILRETVQKIFHLACQMEITNYSSKYGLDDLFFKLFKKGQHHEITDLVMQLLVKLPCKASSSLASFLDALSGWLKQLARQDTLYSLAWQKVCFMQTGLFFLQGKARRLWHHYLSCILFTFERLFRLRRPCNRGALVMLPTMNIPTYNSASCSLFGPEALAGILPYHMFFTQWPRMTELKFHGRQTEHKDKEKGELRDQIQFALPLLIPNREWERLRGGASRFEERFLHDLNPDKMVDETSRALAVLRKGRLPLVVLKPAILKTHLDSRRQLHVSSVNKNILK